MDQPDSARPRAHVPAVAPVLLWRTLVPSEGLGERALGSGTAEGAGAGGGGQPQRPLPNFQMEGAGGGDGEAGATRPRSLKKQSEHMTKGGTHDTPQKKLTRVGGRGGAEACRLPRPYRLKTDPRLDTLPRSLLPPPPQSCSHLRVHHKAQGWEWGVKLSPFYRQGN